MTIPRFELHVPTSVAEASDLLARYPGEAVPYAGGTELLQTMKLGLASFQHLVDIKRIPSLAGIGEEPDGWLRIGATATHREIERSPLVGERLPALRAMERQVANVRVRTTGTLGGNLCFAEPHSDPAAFLLAAGARVRLGSASGVRELDVDAFIAGPLFTDRAPEELLLDVRIPAARPGRGHGFAKLAFFERPAASVACRIDLADGAVADARVAVGSACESPTLLERAARTLVGARASDLGAALEAAIEAARSDVETFDDVNGSADYKRHLVGLLLRAAATSAYEEAMRA